MNVDDTLLLAYVDGELSAERRAEVEAVAAHSPDVAERLAAMQASALPYGAAFAKQALPPVPQQLVQRITELARVSADTRGTIVRKASWPRLAAAFFAGALCCGVMWKLWSGTAPTGVAPGPALAVVSPVPSWIKAVADYQGLYSRETLANITEDHALSEKVIGDLRNTDEMSVRIPDLRSAGLAFKRVQRLSFHNQPVVQIVYLPEQGDPVALCVTRDAQADEAPHAQQIGEMQTVAWRRDGLGYVLLGKGSQLDLSELGRRIANESANALYGSLIRRESHRGGSPRESAG